MCNEAQRSLHAAQIVVVSSCIPGSSGRCVEGRMGRGDDVPTQEMTVVSTVSRSRLPLQAHQLLFGGYLGSGKRVGRVGAGRTMDNRTESRSSLEAFRARAISTIAGAVHSTDMVNGRDKRRRGARTRLTATGSRVDTGVGNCRCHLSLLSNRRTRSTALHIPKQYSTSHLCSRRCRYSPCSCDSTSPFGRDKNESELHFWSADVGVRDEVRDCCNAVVL